MARQDNSMGNLMSRTSDPKRSEELLERVHVRLRKSLMKRIRSEAERDGQTITVKIERTIERGLEK